MLIRKSRPAGCTPKRASFDYSIDFKNTDFRLHPELYRIGKGEQGVHHEECRVRAALHLPGNLYLSHPLDFGE